MAELSDVVDERHQVAAEIEIVARAKRFQAGSYFRVPQSGEEAKPFAWRYDGRGNFTLASIRTGQPLPSGRIRVTGGDGIRRDWQVLPKGVKGIQLPYPYSGQHPFYVMNGENGRSGR